jgi:hypothetical protein
MNKVLPDGPDLATAGAHVRRSAGSALLRPGSGGADCGLRTLAVNTAHLATHPRPPARAPEEHSMFEQTTGGDVRAVFSPAG